MIAELGRNRSNFNRPVCKVVRPEIGRHCAECAEIGTNSPQYSPKAHRTGRFAPKHRGSPAESPASNESFTPRQFHTCKAPTTELRHYTWFSISIFGRCSPQGNGKAEVQQPHLGASPPCLLEARARQRKRTLAGAIALAVKGDPRGSRTHAERGDNSPSNHIRLHAAERFHCSSTLRVAKDALLQPGRHNPYCNESLSMMWSILRRHGGIDLHEKALRTWQCNRPKGRACARRSAQWQPWEHPVGPIPQDRA